MNFDEVKLNNRVQIESEHDDPTYRNVRGIVLGVGEHSLILVTDFGEHIEVLEEKILSLTKITFDKIVSDALSELKNHYNDVYELEMKLNSLKEGQQTLVDKLYDANFLAKFNINGAKNRLDNSIDKDILEFTKDRLTYKISFSSNPNSQIEINFKVFNTFEYYNLNEIGNVDKIIRVYAPNEKEFIQKSFDFSSKLEEGEKAVVHENESLYSVSVQYQLKVDVTQDNFLEVREEIIKGLKKISK